MLVFASLIFTNKNAYAQTGASCATPITLLIPTDTLPDIEQQNGQTKWYEFVADTGYLEISIFSLNAVPFNNFNKIRLWEGRCDSLILVDNDLIVSDSKCCFDC